MHTARVRARLRKDNSLKAVKYICQNKKKKKRRTQLSGIRALSHALARWWKAQLEQRKERGWGTGNVQNVAFHVFPHTFPGTWQYYCVLRALSPEVAHLISHLFRLLRSLASVSSLLFTVPRYNQQARDRKALSITTGKGNYTLCANVIHNCSAHAGLRRIGRKL